MQASTRRATSRLIKLLDGINKKPFRMAGYRAYATVKEVKDFDIVVVGGGPVGLALTCALGMFELLSGLHFTVRPPIRAKTREMVAYGY